jgi:MYXO-CTERM domain-containing protein
MHLSGVTFPTRMRFTHLAGQDYRHDIECTWFGHPVLRVKASAEGRAQCGAAGGTGKVAVIGLAVVMALAGLEVLRRRWSGCGERRRR